MSDFSSMHVFLTKDESFWFKVFIQYFIMITLRKTIKGTRPSSP